MASRSHIIVWMARVSATLAVCVAAGLFFGGCTGGVEGFSPVDPGGTRPAPLRNSVSGSVFASTPEGEIPVEGALVEAARGSRSYWASTDSDGRYVFEELAIGQWTIAVQKSGYRAVTTSVNLRDSAHIDFLLRVDSADLERGESSIVVPSTR